LATGRRHGTRQLLVLIAALSGAVGHLRTESFSCDTRSTAAPDGTARTAVGASGVGVTGGSRHFGTVLFGVDVWTSEFEEDDERIAAVQPQDDE